MPVETLPQAPVGHRVEDSPEHSFSTSIRRAVDTLFTYQQVVDPLQAAPEDEETVQFVELWKQGIMTHLEQTAAAAVSTYLDVFAHFKAGHNVGSREETSGIDPYKIAEVVYGTRIDQLQKSGKLRKPSEISEQDELDDHFDDLTQLYKETCLAMGLAWPPPAREAGDVPKER
jgi:hypothetical protein